MTGLDGLGLHSHEPVQEVMFHYGCSAGVYEVLRNMCECMFCLPNG